MFISLYTLLYCRDSLRGVVRATSLSQVEILLPRLSSDFLELLEDAPVEVIQIFVQGCNFRGLDTENFVCLVHRCINSQVFTHEFAKSKTVAGLLGPLEKTGCPSQALEGHNRHRLHISFLTGFFLTLADNLLDRVRLRTRKGQRLANCFLSIQGCQGHSRNVLCIQICCLGCVVSAPNLLFLKNGNGILPDKSLHKPTAPESCVWHTDLFKVQLCAAFYFHQWDLHVFLTPFDGKENISLNSHRFGALD
mmetsp:Transcript_38449/g.46387  ORF Transcript_38449/g.46387 Transcript_38449/m.46387 type:complete len:250 (+) Transcript_38449:113-862(+)